jgi:NAD(P)-dependent dehydrogenase (short-subunit alcohol dehydrogenase family)
VKTSTSEFWCVEGRAGQHRTVNWKAHKLMTDMKRQVVVITGASAGVGRATARAFARTGSCLGLLARGREGLDGARREVEAVGGMALVIQTDVADPAQVEAAAAAVEEQFGPIDVWVNNAMVSVLSPVKDMTPEDFRRVTEVTYLGYVHGTLTALRRMLPRDKGVIIQVGSALAYRSIPLQSAYCAAKHAVQGFTEALWSELIHDGSRVQVTVVQLPAVNTPQFEWIKTRMPRHPQPVPPIFQPEVIADAIMWASRHKRREVTVGWPAVKAILGDKVIPKLLDYYLAVVGYDAQQTDERVSPDRPHNLWNPVSRDHGAHGTFDSRARSFSVQWWLNKHRESLLLAAITLLTGSLWAKRVMRAAHRSSHSSLGNPGSLVLTRQRHRRRESTLYCGTTSS